MEKHLVNEWARKWFVWISNVPNVHKPDISFNENLTIDIIKNNINFEWSSYGLNFHCKTIDVKDMLCYPDIFNSSEICGNDSVTIEMLEQNAIPMCYRYLSWNANVTDEFLENNISENWNWEQVAIHANITIDFILKHPEIKWDWSRISKNKNISMKCVLKYQMLPWVWSEFYDKPTLTMDIIEAYPDKNWNWQYLDENPNITLDFILRHMDKDWDWNNITKHKNITINHIKQHPDLSWNWHYVSRNPSISIKDIVTNPDKPWEFDAMGELPFSTDRQNYIDFRRNQINILTTHIYMQNVLPTVKNQFTIKPVEHVFFDSYLVSQMNQY